jgi:N-carbamoyl-L-amino-acid hydrolase
MYPARSQLQIDAPRLQRDFNELSEIGKVGKNGVNRPALSPAHLAARLWLRDKISQAGLEFQQDGAGNHSARLKCGPPGARSLLLGSHLDSVPSGGRFDGALGVLAGLEVLRTIQEAGLKLPLNLEMVDFTDEEGTLVSFLGSFALAGKLERAHLEHPRGTPEALQVGLQRAGLTVDGLLRTKRDPGTLAGYLELHVEQGPTLEQAAANIGVVTDIAGITFYSVTFLGYASHAGTTPMATRRDASLGASAFILALRDLVLQQFPDCYANVGNARFKPGFFNIVPDRVELSVEFRAPELLQFERLETEVLNLIEASARRFDLDFESQRLGQRAPEAMDARFQAAIHQAAQGLGLQDIPVVSRAGHDAQVMAQVCPAGMIFVPSAHGISHSPDEYTPWSDCVNGANVLLHSTLRIMDLFA